MARFSKLLLLLGLLLTASCQEGGEAGDLFGQWRMEGSDTKYLSFSGSLLLFKSMGEGEVYGSFRHRGDSLFMQCYSVQGRASDTALVEQTFGKCPFANVRLHIDKADGDRLVLSSGTQQWSFYQY
jgi:hypothetical protein